MPDPPAVRPQHIRTSVSVQSQELAVGKRVVPDRGSRRRWLQAAGVAGIALATAANPLTAQTGTVVGRVTNALTGAPVATAHVIIPGMQGGAPVDADGRFRFTNVPL